MPHLLEEGLSIYKYKSTTNVIKKLLALGTGIWWVGLLGCGFDCGIDNDVKGLSPLLVQVNN